MSVREQREEEMEFQIVFRNLLCFLEKEFFYIKFQYNYVIICLKSIDLQVNIGIKYFQVKNVKLVISFIWYMKNDIVK